MTPPLQFPQGLSLWKLQRLAAVAALVAAAACGTGGGQSADTTTARGASFLGISAVTGSTGTRLDVLTDPLPTEQSGECLTAVAPRAVESESSDGEVLVYIDLVAGPPLPFQGCTLAPRPVTLELQAPVGERRVTDAFGASFRFHEGRWVGCDNAVMTCETEPAACDNGSLRAAISNADVPKGFGMSNQRCEGGFAVVDVDYGAGACPAEDNRCRGQRVRRHFWRIAEGKWLLISSDTAAGCGRVATVAADFPTALCRDLPPPPTGP